MDSPLVCRVCGDVCPAPDLTVDEVTDWQENHERTTGHDEGWVTRPDVVVE